MNLKQCSVIYLFWLSQLVCNLLHADILTLLVLLEMEEFTDGVTTAMVRQLMRDVCWGSTKTSSWWCGYSAALADACSLKELCELRLADSVTLDNASEIEAVASIAGSDALARLCERLKYCLFVQSILASGCDMESFTTVL